jgi:hypothetical protein
VAHLTDTQEEPMSARAPVIESQDDEVKQILFYIRESILKEFKHRAIDEGKSYSRLAEEIIQDYLRNQKPRD